MVAEEDVKQPEADIIQDGAEPGPKKARRRGKKRNQTTESAAEPVIVATSRDITSGVDSFENAPILDEQQTFMPVTEVGSNGMAFFGHVSDELKLYFKSVEQMLTPESIAQKDAEEREIFVQNIFQEIDGKELVLSTDHDCSRILEKLMRVSGEFYLRVFMDRLSGKYKELATHRFASHVLQTLFSLVPPIVAQESPTATVSDPKEGELLSMSELFVGMCTELDRFFPELIVDTYGSHLLRTILLIISGKSSEAISTTIRSKISKKYSESHEKTLEIAAIPREKLPSSFKTKLDEIVGNLLDKIQDTEMRVFSTHAVANPLLQTLLFVLADADSELVNKLIDKMLVNLSDQSDAAQNKQRGEFFSSLMTNASGSHLVQSMLQVMSPAMFDKLLRCLLLGNLREFSQHSVANYVIQTVIETVHTPAQLKLVVDEMMGFLPILLFRARGNVVIKLVEACAKHKTMEAEISAALVQLFKIPDSEQKRRQLIDLALTLQTSEEYEGGPGEIGTVGALLLGAMARLSEPYNGAIITSILSKTDKYLAELGINVVGSRAIQAVLKSPTVDVKTKNKLIKNMDGQFVKLALDKSGCHLVDCCWEFAELGVKKRIAQELVKAREKLAQSFYGRIVLRNCRIDEFGRNAQLWESRWMPALPEKKKRPAVSEIETIFGGTEAKVSKKKLKK